MAKAKSKLRLLLLLFLPLTSAAQKDPVKILQQVYRQLDSVTYLLYDTTRLLIADISRSEASARNYSYTLSYYNALVRFNANEVTSKDSLLLFPQEQYSYDKEGIVLLVSEESFNILAGSDTIRLFDGLPRLRKLFVDRQLHVIPYISRENFRKFIDIPAVPTKPKEATDQARKILADRLLYWMIVHCDKCQCNDLLGTLLQKEKEENWKLQTILEERQRLAEYIYQAYCKQ